MKNYPNYTMPLVMLIKCTGFIHKWLSYICLKLGIVFMILMTIAVLVQVFMRYIFSNPVSWIEEFCIYSMFFLTFLLIPYIILNKMHISMTLLYDRITNDRLKLLVNIFLNIISIYGIFTLMPSIFEVVYNNLEVTTTQMPLTKGQIYLVVPFSFILMITIPIEQILQYLVNKLKKDN